MVTTSFSEGETMVMGGVETGAVIVKEGMLSVVLAFDELSMTVILQLVYVPTLRVLNVMVLFPAVALVVDDEQEPK